MKLIEVQAQGSNGRRVSIAVDRISQILERPDGTIQVVTGSTTSPVLNVSYESFIGQIKNIQKEP